MIEITQVFPTSSVNSDESGNAPGIFTNGAILSEDNLTFALRTLLPDMYVRYDSTSNTIMFISRGHVITAKGLPTPASVDNLYAYIVYSKEQQSVGQLWPFTVDTNRRLLSPVTAASDEGVAVYITSGDFQLDSTAVTNYECDKVTLFENGAVKDNVFNVIIDGNH